MKKIILTVLPVFFAISLSAQSKLPSPRQVKTFLKSNTHIVLDNNILGQWNAEIKTAVDNHWKITDKKYINTNEFDDKRKSTDASFIFETKTYFGGKKKLGVFKTISVALGKKTGDRSDMPSVIDFILAYDDVNSDQCYYKLGISLLFIQKHVKWLKANPDSKGKYVLMHYKTTKEHTKDKTLYLLKSEMSGDVNSLEKIKEIYSGKVKFVTQKEIQKAVDTKNKDVILLHLVAPAKDKDDLICTKMLLGASDAKLYYFNYHKIKKGKKSGTFLKSDFKKINRQ